jgi:hypothetical protein
VQLNLHNVNTATTPPQNGILDQERGIAMNGSTNCFNVHGGMAQVQFHIGNNEKDDCCNNVNATSIVQCNDMKAIPLDNLKNVALSCSQPL